MDYHAVIWTRRASGPVKMGDLLVTTRETRFSYAEEYLDLGPDAPGLSLLSSQHLYGRNPVVFHARDAMPLHPRLMALIPGEGRRNIQRRIYSRVLERRPTPPAPGFEMDWELLLLTGHDGIGHLDVFRDDRVAEASYGRESAPTPTPGNRSRFWRAVRDDVAFDAEIMDVDTIAELLGPTPSAGGMIPKLLVAIPDTGKWDGTFARPGTAEVEGQRYVDVVLKIEPPEYRGVADLEALCLDLHQRVGFEVPRSWRATLDGLELLAVQRFDRTTAGLPLPMESFFSVFATGRREFNSNQDTDLAEVGQWLEKLASRVNMGVRTTQRELYRRLCISVCTGNGDMHLQNLSFLGGPGNVRLSPVYDPAPMRAWPRHDVRFAVPLDFDDEIGGFGENLVELGINYGLTRTQAREVLAWAVEVTADYPARVDGLATVPDAQRNRLSQTVRREQELLVRALQNPSPKRTGPATEATPTAI